MKIEIHMRWICLFLFTVLQWLSVSGQDILLDEPVEAGDLKFFPSSNDINKYYYLTDQPRLAKDEDGNVRFSFLRYVENSTTSQEGEGGGIVHALVVLDVTPEQLRAAEQILQQKKPGAKIEGPIIFSGGTIALISSVAKPDGEFAKEVLGLGTAPILEGQKAAISVQLTKLGAKVLWESFKTPTPDMSISFEMSLKGYRSPIQASIRANFDEVYKSKTMQLAAAVHGPVLIGAEINAAFEELRKSGAIVVTSKGADADMEKALETAYNKLTDLMFNPVGGTGTPSLAQVTSSSGIGSGSLLDKATASLTAERDKATTRNDQIRAKARTAAEVREALSKETVTAEEIAPPVKPASKEEDKSLRDDVIIGPRKITSDPSNSQKSAADKAKEDADKNADPLATVPTASVLASFQMKEVRQTGTFSIDLNKMTADNLTLRFDGNFGNINCPECFREVNLESPTYQQREIFSYLDNSNAQDFAKYINFVNVAVRKVHENGDITDRQIRIDKTNFNESGNNFKVVYGWKGDTDRLRWLDYEYKVAWNYFGGHTLEMDWVRSTLSSVPLSSPLIRKSVDIEASPDNYAAGNIRSCEVKVFYKLGDQEHMRSVRLNPKTNQLSGQVELLLPRNSLEYEYELTWFFNNGTTQSSGRKQGMNSTIIYADLF